MSDETKYMDIDEFRKSGLLQELNRQFLHPRGLALEVRKGEDGKLQLGGIWDCREDDEGIVYANAPAEVKGELAAELYREKVKHRRRRFGWAVQPLGQAPPETKLQLAQED